MGFSSYLCAGSGESIPADCIEPCEVTAFLKDGRTITGTYDGYQRLIGEKRFSDMTALAQFLGIKTKRSFFDWNALQQDQFKKLFSEQFPDQQVHTVLQGTVVLDMQPMIGQPDFPKLVKTKHVKHGMTYDSLPENESCPWQGYFYPRRGTWNRKAKA